MKTTPLEAHRALIPWNEKPIGYRRRLGLKPLRKHSRLLDQNILERVQRECDGIAVIQYYGHPSRRMAIAYPLKGLNGLDATREAIREVITSRRGSVSCGNYVFPLNS